MYKDEEPMKNKYEDEEHVHVHVYKNTCMIIHVRV